MKKYITILIMILISNTIFSVNTKNNLEGRKYIICLDPGHQEKRNYEYEEIAPNSTEKKIKVSGGTRGVITKKYEYQLTLEIGIKIKKELEKQGYAVIMTREKNNVNISNKERALMANKVEADLYIRLHADGDNDKNVKGATVLISSNKNKYTYKVQKESEKFAKILLDEYVKYTGVKNRGVIYRDDLTGTNWAKVPTVLLEMGFMTNEEEDRNLSSPKYQEKIVRGVVVAVDRYFKK